MSEVKISYTNPKIRDWSLDKGFLGGNGEKFKRENQKIPFKKQKLLS